MLASLSKVAAWVAIAGELGLVAAILFSEKRRMNPTWQVRGALIMLVGGAMHRVNTYLIAFDPGANYHYFPAVPELLIIFGIIAVVKTFPILGGHGPGPARSKA